MTMFSRFGGQLVRRLSVGLIALVATGFLPTSPAVAKRRLPPEPNPEKGTLAVRIEHDLLCHGDTRGAPRHHRSFHADTVEVYFARLDDSSGGLRAESVVKLNRRDATSWFTRDDDWYLLNVTPGRWIVVGMHYECSERKPGTSHSDGYDYRVFFSEDLIAKTVVDVTPGRIAFMGVVSCSDGKSMRKMLGKPREKFEDSIEWHYFSLVSPEDAEPKGPGRRFMSLNVFAQVARDEGLTRGVESARWFWTRSAKKRIFKKNPQWLELVQGELAAVGDAP